MGGACRPLAPGHSSEKEVLLKELYWEWAFINRTGTVFGYQRQRIKKDTRCKEEQQTKKMLILKLYSSLMVIVQVGTERTLLILGNVYI